jgi:hypothetical protein
MSHFLENKSIHTLSLITNIILIISILVLGTIYISNEKSMNKFERGDIHSAYFDPRTPPPFPLNPPSENMEMTHSHKDFDIPDSSSTIPTIDLKSTKDPMFGYNIQVITTNFQFAPEKVGTETGSYNEGHAHLYINSAKAGRVYSTWLYIPQSSLRPGENIITISLNTNTHQELHYKSKAILATVKITN